MRQPKLRDSKKLNQDVYPLGELPPDILTKIGGGIVYRIFTGRKDLTGDDWGDIFAKAIDGHHLASPVGIADVDKDKTAWSMKTVKSSNPFTSSCIRLISGRCSPDYSYGILDPHADVQKTGDAVLGIWNSRVDIARAYYSSIRVSILVRDDSLRNFIFFEEYLDQFRIAEFEWKENANGNLVGINKRTGEKCFTWQPHGSQFTIHTDVPEDAIKFKLRHPDKISEDEALKQLNYNSEWIEIVSDQASYAH